MKQIQMPAKDFEKLKKTVEWYDAMPAFIEVGDRFHENVSEEMENLFPSIPEIEDDDYFNINTELTGDNKLIVTLQSVTDYEDEIQIELVPV